MRHIIETIIFTLTVFFLAGCTANYEDYNTDPTQIYDMPSGAYIQAMIEPMMFMGPHAAQMVDAMVGAYGGYLVATNRWENTNFDTFNPSDDWNASPWNSMFVATYSNFFQVEKLTEGVGHWYAMAKLVRAATMMRVADCYGPIPYSKVVDGNLYVEYDSGEEVYRNIISDLQESASLLYNFAATNSSFRPFADFDPTFLNGDYGLWAQLANSLTLRAAIRTDNQEAFISALNHPAGIISTNVTRPAGADGNPYYTLQGPWNDHRASSSIVDYMNGYNDPRRAAYFTFSTRSGFTSRYYGARTGYASSTSDSGEPYSQMLVDTSDPITLFYAAENEFLLAEAALKGWSVPNTAKSYYEAGVTLSMSQHGVAPATIAAYLADNTLVPASHTEDWRPNNNYNRTSTVKIAWDDSGATNLEQIITQKWIANFPLGLEAWADYRRTGFPELAPSVDNLSGGVVSDLRGARRLEYPYSEKNLNSANYTKSVNDFFGGAGGDTQASDLFWA
ncbi:MAG: SusD/RagB family nutrient-binding outer membrane lipoprotein, partial [Alistipes sp.]|nr:SusD/RagB family nutrient-binding outer membrane lipoprotein [Alistipes sp.]